MLHVRQAEHRQTDRQYAILSMARQVCSQNLCQTMNGYVETACLTKRKQSKHKKMQLDVGSEPYLSTGQTLCPLINHTFYYNSFANRFFQIHSYNIFRDLNYYPVTDGRTDRRTDRQKAMHMSPPCNMHRWAQKSYITGLRCLSVCL